MNLVNLFLGLDKSKKIKIVLALIVIRLAFKERSKKVK